MSQKEKALLLAKTESDIKFIVFQNKSYNFYNVDDEVWKVLMKNFLSYRSDFRKKFTGGFTVYGEIFIKKSRKIGRKRLILHEIGHILGYQHTWKPTIMNPTWLFRWLNRF